MVLGPREGFQKVKKTQKGELLAEITVVNFNCNSMADDFILERKWFSISWLIVRNKKALGDGSSDTVIFSITFLSSITWAAGSTDKEVLPLENCPHIC